MKFPFFSRISSKEEFFLGLFLKEEEGIAIVMARQQGKIIIKEREKFQYTNGWENLTEDVDEALYKLEKELNTEVVKTIFFVYSHLVDDRTNDIKKPYLSKIKELVKNLELEALGYIECFEAVSFYLEKKEEISLTAVLLELDKKQFSVFVYKGGKVSYKKTLARTDNIIDDFLSGIEGIKGRAMLPSRMILYDSNNIDEAATKIVSYRWSEDYFVQIPKIDILKEEEIITGLINVFEGQIKSKEPTVSEENKIPSKESFGFVMGEDVGEVKDMNEIGDMKEEKLKIKWQLPKFPKLPVFNFKFSLKGKTAAILGVIIIVLSLGLNEYFFHRAQLTIYLPFQTIKKTIEETIDYKVASLSADFTGTTTTTGKKEIGDKAKGSVNIHNFDDKEKVFSKGTTLEAAGLQFILDGDVKVASSTLAVDGSAKLPGKSVGLITALNIGPESNLSKNQRFKIGNLAINDFFAINETPLSGGTKKEIRTVAKADQDKLEKSIADDAKKQMKIPSLSKEEAIIPDLSQINLTMRKFSKEVGEESNSLTLNAKAKTTYFSYNKANLNKKILYGLKKDLKQGYQIKEGNLNFKITDAEINNDNLLSLKLDVNSRAVKEFNREEIIKKIIGKSKVQLKSILKSGPDIQGYDVVINEPLPFLKNFLPFFKKNIFLKISSL
ncbi:MAG: hypothetical protein V1803_01425 [Candidatus Roizmanbacteria bacterium]